jgi:hypothetical protein
MVRQPALSLLSALPLVLLLPLVAGPGCGGSGGSSARVDGGPDDEDAGSSVDGASGGEDGGERDDGGTRPLVETNTGSACSADDACTGGGTNRCLTVVQDYTFPSGYCTTTCAADDECGADGRCPLAPLLTSPLLPLLPGDIQEAIREFSSCFRSCSSDDDCRVDDGYRCGPGRELFPTLGQLGVDTSALYCLPPAPDMLLDSGTDAGPGLDAGSDAGPELDGGADAGTDAGDDAALDAGADQDAGADAGV